MRALSKHITAMPRSGIGGIMDIAERLQGVVHLEVGEPHLATPPHIVAAAIRALQDGFTRYTPSAGLPSLRVLLAEKLRARNRISASPESVAVTPGGVFASAVALLTVAGAGDEVLLPDPGWPNYGLQTMAVGIRRVPYHLRPGRGFLPDLDEISRLITGRTRAIFVNSPSNPTGAVFPEAVLAAILELARARDLYVIADEAYEDMVFEGHQHSLGICDTEGSVITL
jgi:aspartate/methionine/tyrosine aminotransferase